MYRLHSDARLFHEDDGWIAQIPALDVASFGYSRRTRGHLRERPGFIARTFYSSGSPDGQIERHSFYRQVGDYPMPAIPHHRHEQRLIS